jgi:hypothetical protein
MKLGQLPAELIEVNLILVLRFDALAAWQSAFAEWDEQRRLLHTVDEEHSGTRMWKLVEGESFPGSYTQLWCRPLVGTPKMRVWLEATPGHRGLPEALALMQLGLEHGGRVVEGSLSFNGDGYAAGHEDPAPPQVLEALVRGAELRYDPKMNEPWGGVLFNFRPELRGDAVHLVAA